MFETPDLNRDRKASLDPARQRGVLAKAFLLKLSQELADTDQDRLWILDLIVEGQQVCPRCDTKALFNHVAEGSLTQVAPLQFLR